MEIVWIDKAVVLALHESQLAEHGGSLGLRDEGLLDSALARPRNLAAYGEPSLYDLAAGYAYGLCANHPFIDGNKRTSFVTSATFLLLNGSMLDAPEPEAVRTWLALAAGDMEEAEVAEWLKANTA